MVSDVGPFPRASGNALVGTSPKLHDRNARDAGNNTRLCLVTSAPWGIDVAACVTSIFCWNAIVPPWLEILLDFVGFAGFIGLASWQKAPREDDEGARR